MAVGDMFTEMSDVAASGTLDIQPASGAEVVINNIYHEYDIEVYRYDGTLDCLVATEVGGGVLSFINFRCNNTDRIRVKNTDGSNARMIGYDGIYTKAAS